MSLLQLSNEPMAPHLKDSEFLGFPGSILSTLIPSREDQDLLAVTLLASLGVTTGSVECYTMVPTDLQQAQQHCNEWQTMIEYPL